MGKDRAKLSPTLEAELRGRLEDLLDQRDDAAAKKRSVNGLLTGHLKTLDATIFKTRRQLKGLDLTQYEIPGTEMPAPAEDPVVAGILKLAGGIVARSDEKPAATLTWREEGTGRFASVSGGSYELDRGEQGWSARFEATGGAIKTIALEVTEAEAKAACEQHHLDHLGDEILRESGDDDLTKKTLRGPPTKHKKGR